MKYNPKKQPRKYDWDNLKNIYISQEHDQPIIDFLRQQLGNNKVKWSGWIAKVTGGWIDDRSKFKEETAKKALEIAQDKMSKNMAIALNNCRSAVMKHFTDTKKSERLSPKDLKILWSIIRTESNLPTIIQKNEGVSNVILPTVIIQKDYGSKPIEVDGETD